MLSEKTWTDRLTEISPEVKSMALPLISRVEQELHCISQPYHRWFSFYVEDPKMSTRFAVLTLGEKTSTICFRINPDEFKDDSEQLRKVSGFFFPTGTERRIYITNDNAEQILKYLKQAYYFSKG